jgi:hypothetical protein
MIVIGGLLSQYVITPLLKPILRFVGGLVAIPIFRFLVKKVFRFQTTDTELERDLEHWFRGCIILLAATANMEHFLFNWVPWHKQDWLTVMLRLMLAIGVIEYMPDQDLFALAHKAPPKMNLTSKEGWRKAWAQRIDFAKGYMVLHLRRSSPVFVIMAVIFGGSEDPTGQNLRPDEIIAQRVGWICYGVAIFQYFAIALATNREQLLENLRHGAAIPARLRQELDDGEGGQFAGQKSAEELKGEQNSPN